MKSIPSSQYVYGSRHNILNEEHRLIISVKLIENEFWIGVNAKIYIIVLIRKNIYKLN